jgi:hypothetical protein
MPLLTNGKSRVLNFVSAVYPLSDLLKDSGFYSKGDKLKPSKMQNLKEKKKKLPSWYAPN